jgi:hypothetical protein
MPAARTAPRRKRKASSAKNPPHKIDAEPVPRDWDPRSWYKAYNAADSRYYVQGGRDAEYSRRKRDAGETRTRALTLWAKYPKNKAHRIRMQEAEDAEEEEEEEEEDEVSFMISY